MRATITPEEGEEVTRLLAEMPIAAARAANAMPTGGRPLDGELLRRFLEEDAKHRAIVDRIKEIYGIAGDHWMA